MTTESEAGEAIYKAFFDGWASATPATADNEEFDAKELPEWARLSIRHNLSTQETLGEAGARKYDRGGSIFIEIYTAINTGVKRTVELKRLARDIFEGKRLTGTTVRFNDVIPTEQGPDGTWYRSTVEAIFVYTEIK